ncbi:MAG: glycerophosphodiester phosphodiesterase family protein [Flavobacteriales bacterium]
MLNRVEIFLQGHRGFRGRFPENSLEAARAAIQLGVDAIELDVVVSADGKMIVSHEPYMCHTLCTKPDGGAISESESQDLNLFKMSAAEIAKYSYGVLPYSKFPDQQKMVCHKLDLISFCKQLLESDEMYLPQLTIELKSAEKTDSIFHPAPKEYVDAVLRNIDLIDERWPIAIQSFDLRLLKELDQRGVELPLIALNDNSELDIDAICEQLNFVPDGYGPHFDMVNAELVNDCAELGVDLSVWTVNDLDEAERLFGLGVRNFITDFPDLFV